MDVTTLYVRTTGEIVPVAEMHPNHARNALALVLSNPEHAAQQYMSPVLIAERNIDAHARASGFRYKVKTHITVQTPTGPATFDADKYAQRRAEARALHKAARQAGFRSAFYRLGENGVLERVR